MTDIERLRAECRRLGIDPAWADREPEPGAVADSLKWISEAPLTPEQEEYGRLVWARLNDGATA